MGYSWNMGPSGRAFVGLFWLLVMGLLVGMVTLFLRRGVARTRPAVELLDRQLTFNEIHAEQYRRAHPRVDIKGEAR